MKKIVLITPFSIAQNPRVLKEYELLKKSGYAVRVLYGERDKWASSLQPLNNNDFELVGGRFGTFYHFITRIIYKLSKPILPTAFAQNRLSILLLIRALFSARADLYIGHNLAALPVAVIVAKKRSSRCGFDAEDFHRNESTDDPEHQLYKITSKVEKQYLPHLDYLTAASPLIADAYNKLKLTKVASVVNNVFSKEFIPASQTENQPKRLSLFWFSQTIGKFRGIETVIGSLGILKEKPIELHLLGNIDSENQSYFISLVKKNNLDENLIFFHRPIAPEKIFNFCCKFDIGLALETGAPYNRDICLTNKIYTYLSSGLAIIASETTAQKKFMDDFKGIGQTFPLGDEKKLAEIIQYYNTNREMLHKTRQNAKVIAESKLNWEIEGNRLSSIIQKILN